MHDPRGLTRQDFGEGLEYRRSFQDHPHILDPMLDCNQNQGISPITLDESMIVADVI